MMLKFNEKSTGNSVKKNKFNWGRQFADAFPRSVVLLLMLPLISIIYRMNALYSSVCLGWQNLIRLLISASRRSNKTIKVNHENNQLLHSRSESDFSLVGYLYRIQQEFLNPKKRKEILYNFYHNLSIKKSTKLINNNFKVF